MVSRAKIKELMNESACSHSKDKKPGEGCDKPKPGLAAGGCAFDGAQISLFPYADAVHLVHGPQTCLGASWESRETKTSYQGRDHTQMGFTTGIHTNDVIFGGINGWENRSITSWNTTTPKQFLFIPPV